MSTIEEAFRARLVAASGLAENRVFNEIPEQQPAALPIIYFERKGTPTVRRAVDTGRQLFERALFSVGVIASSTDDAATVRQALYDGLDGWRGTSLGVDILRCHRVFHGTAPIADGDFVLRIIEQDFEVTFRG